jgi:hypothetical protein
MGMQIAEKTMSDPFSKGIKRITVLEPASLAAASNDRVLLLAYSSPRPDSEVFGAIQVSRYARVSEKEKKHLGVVARDGHCFNPYPTKKSR